MMGQTWGRGWVGVQIPPTLHSSLIHEHDFKRLDNVCVSCILQNTFHAQWNSASNYFQLGSCNEQKNPEYDGERHLLCNIDTVIHFHSQLLGILQIMKKILKVIWILITAMNMFLQNLPGGKSELDASQKCPSGCTKLTKTGSFLVLGMGQLRHYCWRWEWGRVHSRLFWQQRPDFLWGALFPIVSVKSRCQSSQGVGQDSLPSPGQQAGPWAELAGQLGSQVWTLS